MKKASLVLSLLAASTSAAWAQSSVQLYGIVDAAARYTTKASSDQKAIKTLAPGGMSQSRLGVNITEDMGGGLKAIANLEHRLNSDTGVVSAAEFWRQSWVGIQSNDFGQVRLGRQYNILFDLYTSSFPSFKYSPYIEAYKPEIGLSLAARQDNMVKWLGQFGKVFAEVQVSAGEGSTTGLPNKSIGGLVRYNDGALALGGAYMVVTEQTQRKVKAAALGASYTTGPWYFHASWANNKFENIASLVTSPAVLADPNSPFRVALTTRGGYTSGLLGNVFNLDSADIKSRDGISLGATFQVTTQLNLGANYWRAKQKHYGLSLAPLGLVTAANSTSKVDFFAFVADYAFSKRTDAYFEVDHTKTSGEVMFANGARTRTGTMVGIRHRF